MRMSDLIGRQEFEKDTNVLHKDLIRKQDAIEEIARWIGYIDEDMILRIQTGLKKLPSAQRWIPVSERMPKEHESIWAKAKGTDQWSESMWEKQSDEVIVTELFEDGTLRTETACTHDGEWYVKVKTVKRKIVAWMPLPDPWKGE